MDLMYCQPKADENGEVRPKPFGGRRRIDRILVDTKACQSKGIYIRVALILQIDFLCFICLVISGVRFRIFLDFKVSRYCEGYSFWSI